MKHLMRIGTKVTGHLEDGTFYKTVKQKNRMNILNGFGVARVHLVHPSVKRVEITYQGQKFKATVEQFNRNGIPWTNPGYEPQIILPEQFFNLKDEQQVELLNGSKA